MKLNDIWILAVVLLVAAAIGCNAFKGAGKDIEKAGKTIQKAVEHKN